MTLAKRSQSNYPSFPSFFDRILEGDLMDWSNFNFSNTNTTLPAVNVKESENDYTIEVAAPGMTKNDFKINFENGRLTISSEHQDEKEEKKKGQYTRKEFSYQSFQRSFSIPENEIDGEKIVAKYNDGILNITLPKRDEVKPKPAREIKIS